MEMWSFRYDQRDGTMAYCVDGVKAAAAARPVVNGEARKSRWDPDKFNRNPHIMCNHRLRAFHKRARLISIFSNSLFRQMMVLVKHEPASFL